MAELLDHGVRSFESRPRTAKQYYCSVDHAVQVFSRYFGPTLRALEVAGPREGPQLLADLGAVFDRYNVADDGTAVIENAYLQTIAVRGS